MESDFEPCPQTPCESCTGDSAVVKNRDEDGKPVCMTSWEWCQRTNVCGATIDWEKVAGRG